MRKIDIWLNEYRDNHQHPKNIAVHYLSTPLLMLGLWGALFSLSHLILALVILAYLAFYFVLSKPMFIGILALLAIELVLVYWIDSRVQIPMHLVSAGLVFLGWLLQFLAHSIEGKKVRMDRAVMLLLVGPAYLLWPLYRFAKIQL